VDGHVHAFAFFGRVPQSVLYDNDRCLVAKILPPLLADCVVLKARRWRDAIACRAMGGTRKRAKLFEPGSCRTPSFMTATAARARATTRGLSRTWSVLRGATSWCPLEQVIIGGDVIARDLSPVS